MDAFDPEDRVSNLALTLLLAFVLAAWLLRRRCGLWIQPQRDVDAAEALTRLLAGEGTRVALTAEARAMELIFVGETGVIQDTFRERTRRLDVDASLVLDHAEELKDLGNQAFKGAQYVQAAEHYATALLALESSSAEQVPSHAKEPTGTELQLVCGQRVAMRLKAGAQVESVGIICCDNEDDTFDIILDDGDDRDAVPRAQIRPLPPDEGEGGSASAQEAARRVTLTCACFVNSARCAFQTNNFVMAAALASHAIEMNPANHVAFFVRGRARLAIPTLDLAKDDITQARLLFARLLFHFCVRTPPAPMSHEMVYKLADEADTCRPAWQSRKRVSIAQPWRKLRRKSVPATRAIVRLLRSC